MKKLLAILLMLLLVGMHHNLWANGIIKGVCVNETDTTTVAFVLVKVQELDQWAYTNATGEFGFSGFAAGTYVLHFTCLGYVPKTVVIKLKEGQELGLKVVLQSKTLALDEVIVSAKSGGGMSSSTVLNKSTIEHVQPNSLYDALQLVPGNLIENSDMSAPQKITIREIGNEANTTAGVQVILDGMPIDNDLNLQTLNTNRLSQGITGVVQPSTHNFETTVGHGMDARQISTDNIESVEVIRGVPSVEYGNLTSGAVLVKTKTGKTPFEVKLKTDPNTKQAFVGKGMSLAGTSVLNVNFDYLQSYNDIRLKIEKYDRINGQVGFATVLNEGRKPFSLNAKFNVFTSLDDERSDPEALKAEEAYSSQNQGASLSINGKWLAKSQVITELSYQLNASTSRDYSYQKSYRSGSQTGVSTSFEEGENYGVALPSESLTEFSIEGRPTHIYAKVNGVKQWSFGVSNANRFMLGLDYAFKKNYGNGTMFDIANPRDVFVSNSRPQTYKNIPALQNAALFMEDKLDVKIGSTRVKLQAGIRFQNFQSKQVANWDWAWYAAPAANLNYGIVDNKQALINRLSLRAGAGILYEGAPIAYLYPHTSYYDLLSLYHHGASPQYRTYVFTTRIYDDARELQPTRNEKLEVGFDVGIRNIVHASLTAFSEKLTHGYGISNQYMFIPYNNYNDPTLPENEIPDISELPYVVEDYIGFRSLASNRRSSEKYGVEYVLNFGKVPALHTQFIVDGAWLRTKRILNTQNFHYLPMQNSSESYTWVGVYPAGESQVQERLNSTLRMVTHMPKLSMVLTTTTQVLWYEKMVFPYYQEVPIYLYNKDGEEKVFTDEMAADVAYRAYVRTSADRYFNEENLPPLLLFNFRLSKDLGKQMRLSFFANNVLNNRPIYKSNRSGSTIRRNQSAYFGADLRIFID